MRYIRIKNLYIDYLLILILSISYVFGVFEHFIIAYGSVFIHEAAHVFVAKIYGCKINKVFFLCLGTRAEIDLSTDGKYQKYLIYIAGPLTNLAIALFFTMFFIPISYYYKRILIITNIILAVFNLLPISPLDGSKILSTYIASKYGFFQSRKINNITFLFVIVLLFMAGILILIFSGNISIIIITFFLIFEGLDQEEAAFLNVRNLYYRKSKLLKKGYYEVREIVVLDKMTLGETFKLMDYDKYHIINILDENLIVIYRFTETELLTAINKYGYNLTLMELLDEVVK